MSRQQPQALAPKFMREFQCLGTDCPQTCCSNWRIPINKSIWKKYQTIELSTLRIKLKKHVHREPSGSAHYALIGLKEDHTCQFLDSDKLCSIQKEIGFGALSDICQTYPRKFQSIGSEWQLWGSLSCIEASRLALSSPDALNMQSMTLTQYANEKQIPLAGRLIGNSRTEQAHQLVAAAVRDKLIGLAQDHGLSGLQTLKLWILMIRQIATQQRNWQAALATATPATFEDALNQGLSGLADILDSYNSESLITRLTLIDELPVMKANQRLELLKDFSNIVSQVNLGLSTIEDLLKSSHDCTVEDMNTGYNLLHDFEAVHPWVINNIIVSQLMSVGWYAYVLNAELAEDALLLLVMWVALMRHWMAAQAGISKSVPTIDMAIRATSTLSRSIEHNDEFSKEILKVLEANQARTLAMAFAVLGSN